MRTALTLVATALVACAPAVRHRDRTADEAAIRGVIAHHEATLNARDVAGWVASFTPDGDLVLMDGPRIVGPDSLILAVGASLTALPPSLRFTITVTALSFLGPDVAIVETEARFSEGELTGNRGTAVLIREGSAWRMRALRLYALQAGP